MTREEAKRRIECCRNFLANNFSDMGEPNITAFNMAIKALEQEPQESEEDNKAWVKDYSVGYDTARVSIKTWCTKKVEKIINSQRKGNVSSWSYGYKSALIDVIERIERL